MEGEYKKAFDFVSNAGQGLMEEGKDIIKIVKKICPHYYELTLQLFFMIQNLGDIADAISINSEANDDDPNEEDYADGANDDNKAHNDDANGEAEDEDVKESNKTNKGHCHQ
jgi:hypothetical protein